ncbi:ABC transporter ATP-binding protein [Streptomyces sp. NPDC094448]|uniref:ABC transporter ATP-binding protein n=1 Tax=Streptomyces sp. NPDC094448 TaxID=3366063 RepID=UPI00380990D1
MTDGPAPPVIDFRQVGLVYPGRPPVVGLHPGDLTVRRGEFVTVVGPSGSGKSTLLNVIGLLDRPTTGGYFLDGLDTGGLGDAERTALRGHRIGFVFQAFHLLSHRTALENVMLGMVYNSTVPRGDRRERARQALLRVGLGHRLDALPTRMSGGERQRVAIARALVHAPSLLLCDEPTGNLDSVNSGRVLDLLEALHEDGMTVLVITHDQEVAARGTRTVAVQDGVLVPVVPASAVSASAVPAPAVPAAAETLRDGAGPTARDLPGGRAG